MKQHVTIRAARVADAAACARLGSVPELAKPNGEPISRRYYEAFARRSPFFFVAHARGHIVGFILGEPLLGGLAICHLLAVAPPHRNRGIGSALLDVFERACRARRRRIILCYAFAGRPAAVAFFRRRGYVVGSHVRECTKAL